MILKTAHYCQSPPNCLILYPEARVPMPATAIEFKSKGLSLEGIVNLPAELPKPYPALLVCHPHPLLGGSMHNEVVAAVCRAAERGGVATLRFNFRGVGDSEGAFSDGEGEQEDLASAMKLLRRWPGIDRRRIAVAGYSFGASVVLRGLRHCKPARSFTLIAPPVTSVLRSSIRGDKRPKLFIVGEVDRLVPTLDIQRALDEVAPPVQFQQIADANHQLAAHESLVADRAVEFIMESLRK